MNTEFLLSDKFLEFSAKITAIQEKKKTLLVEFKKHYEAHKAQIKGLEDEVAKLVAEYENENNS